MTDGNPIKMVEDAREKVKEAQAVLEDMGKAAIRQAVNGIFDREPATENVAWASKSSEYNDEGMYPGIAGPVVNVDPEEHYQDWVYDYNPNVPAGLSELKSVLDAIGEDTLTELFDDEYMVIATRKADGTLNFETEYLGY